VIRVVVPGEPNAQRRPRAFSMGGHVRMHSDKRDGQWRGRAQVHMAEAMAGREPLTGDLELRVRGVWECPRSMHRKRDPREAGWFQGRKDADNVAKAVQDAGNGVLWVDDRQVVRLVVEKWRGAQGEAPRVEIEVREVERPTGAGG
jgi:Holliday junction resolvase RusA-like endonuclease